MSRMTIRTALITAAILFCAAPAWAQSKAAIQKLEDQWAAAFNKGDAVAVAAFYADDAYVLPAGAPMVNGHDAIQSYLAQAAQQIGDVKCTTIDVKPLGRKAAREIGTCTFKTKGATPQDSALKYAVVWVKTDSGWKLIQDIWNMDK
jgi:uncharacterized protein (TIGR02246 family)